MSRRKLKGTTPNSLWWGAVLLLAAISAAPRSEPLGGSGFDKHQIPIPGLISSDAETDITRYLRTDPEGWPEEVVAEAIERLLMELSTEIRKHPSLLSPSALQFISSDFTGSASGLLDGPLTNPWGLQSQRQESALETGTSKSSFNDQFQRLLLPFGTVTVADFRVVGLEQLSHEQDSVVATIRFELAGRGRDEAPLQRIGRWRSRWTKKDPVHWFLVALDPLHDELQRAPGPFFRDITASALEAGNPAFQEQLNRGGNEWAHLLDSATGMDFYRMEGVAVGDFDGDGWEDFYVSQPGGLPNRLFRNRGDGTFEDITESSGLGILDATATAMWADFNNSGRPELLVVGREIWLFENDGSGLFRKSDHARFEILPQERGSLMSVALADFDRDGFLDIYVCQYSPAGGSIMGSSLHQPTPYFDANNGPPNHLFRNNGDGTFTNVTRESGLMVNNHRWSFAAAWGDYTGNGFPDLYVANDFGRNNLYRNNGDATFTDVAAESGVEDVAAGMSVAWGDYDNDGFVDLYVANIWSAVGQRLMAQAGFQPQADEPTRNLFRRYAKGNSLFRNRGDGTFQEITFEAGVENGGWAWGSDFLDFDNDGWDDLLIVNGYITNDLQEDLESYHWRRIAATSPLSAIRSREYDESWRNFQDLMRESGFSTHGRERNRFFYNRGDGTFADVSALSGLDLSDDGRSFAVFDFNRDGALDLVIKNRSAPQVRLLVNNSLSSFHSITFLLVGTQSNRDAVGAKVTVQSGERTWTREVRSGSGFLSQHSRRLHFGLGSDAEVDRVRIDWPSGASQEFHQLKANQLVEIVEGRSEPHMTPYRTMRRDESPTISSPSQAEPAARQDVSLGTWLVEPFRMPALTLADASDQTERLAADARNRPLLLNFWSLECPPCTAEKRTWEELLSSLKGADFWSVRVAYGGEKFQRRFADATAGVRELQVETSSLSVLNTLVKHIFARRSNLGLPTTLLLDSEGRLVKIFRGPIDPEGIRSDIERLSLPGAGMGSAVPFPGTYLRPLPDRQEQIFGIAYELLRNGHHDEARTYFEETLRLNPRLSMAWNNLGAIQLRQGALDEALQSFQEALNLDPGLVEIRFNLGTALAMKGRLDDAVRWLEQAVELDAGDAEIWNNLGNAYLNMRRPERARRPLEQALALDPNLAEAHNNLGIIYGEGGRLDLALQHFQEAVRARPDFAQGYLNIAIVYLNTNRPRAAVDMLQKVLDLEPGHLQALEILNQLQNR